jgi:hypothetical protein
MVRPASPDPGQPQSLAAAAMREGTFHLGNSFRFQEPRGAFCHSGWCQQCKVRLSDCRVGLACELAPDVLALLIPPSRAKTILGKAARLMLRPWFHEGVVPKLAVLQSLFLGIVRRSSGALPISTIIPVAGGKWQHESCKTLIIGGGPAGLAAAEAMSPDDDVLVVERNPGGDGQNRVTGFRVLRGTALGLYPDKNAPSGFHLLCGTPLSPVRIAFRKLIVASGVYERILFVKGSTLPGVISLSAFEQLLSQQALPATSKVVVFAPKPQLTRALKMADEHGVRVDCVIGDISERSSTRVVRSAYPVRMRGRKRLSAVELSDGSTVICDVFVVGFVQPSYEFQMQAGRQVSQRGPGYPLETGGGASFPLLVVGSAAGHSGIDAATRHASDAVHAWLRGDEPMREAAAVPMPSPDQVADDVVLCPCEDVLVGDVRAACRDGFDYIENVKRRTGAGTGPCQGKLCHALLVQTVVEAGGTAAIPTVRPLARPQSLASFAGPISD